MNTIKIEREMSRRVDVPAYCKAMKYLHILMFLSVIGFAIVGLFFSTTRSDKDISASFCYIILGFVALHLADYIVILYIGSKPTFKIRKAIKPIIQIVIAIIFMIMITYAIYVAEQADYDYIAYAIALRSVALSYLLLIR